MATVKDFSFEEKLVSVLALQKIDSKIDDIKTLKGELPMEVKDLEDEIEGLQTRINNIDSEINNINTFNECPPSSKKLRLTLINSLSIFNISDHISTSFLSTSFDGTTT